MPGRHVSLLNATSHRERTACPLLFLRPLPPASGRRAKRASSRKAPETMPSCREKAKPSPQAPDEETFRQWHLPGPLRKHAEVRTTEPVKGFISRELRAHAEVSPQGPHAATPTLRRERGCRLEFAALRHMQQYASRRLYSRARHKKNNDFRENFVPARKNASAGLGAEECFT